MLRKQGNLKVKVKELLNMVSASERSRESELSKMISIQTDINFVSGLQILIQYLYNIQQRSQMIISATSVDSLQFLLPLLLGIIWASPRVGVDALQQFSDMIKVLLLQDSEFLQNLDQSPFIGITQELLWNNTFKYVFSRNQFSSDIARTPRIRHAST